MKKWLHSTCKEDGRTFLNCGSFIVRATRLYLQKTVLLITSYVLSFDFYSSLQFWTQVTLQTRVSSSSPPFCERKPSVFILQLAFYFLRVAFLFDDAASRFWSCLKTLWQQRQQQPAYRFMWFSTSVKTIKTFFFFLFAKSCLFQTARLWYAISVVIMAVAADCGWWETALMLKYSTII